MFMLVLNILCHNFLGANRPAGWVRTDRKVGTKGQSLGTKDPWVRKDWIPARHLLLFESFLAKTKSVR